MSFVELRAHSAFSFGDGACTPEALVARAAGLGMPALGLTDTADLGGVIRFALACEKEGIRPVVGAELIVDGYPAAFYAMNERGFRNLASLVTRARVGRSLSKVEYGDGQLTEAGLTAETQRAQRFAEGFRAASNSPVSSNYNLLNKKLKTDYGSGALDGDGRLQAPALRNSALSAPLRLMKHGSPTKFEVHERRRGKPHIAWNDLAEHSEGLFALTGPLNSEIASHLKAHRQSEAAFTLSRWSSLFGDRFAVEVQMHHVSGSEAALAASLIDLANAASVPWVATNEPRYLDGGGRLVHDLLTALRNDMDVDTAASWGVLHPNGEWRLKSAREMALLWKGREEGLAQSQRIALECDFDLRWLRPPLPHFEPPPDHPCARHGGDDDAMLHEIAFAGARERWGDVDDRQHAQLEHELGVIRRLGFAGFFLVMWDAVRFARSRNILCQGRGSAANSAVAYCLAITAVDPVRHGLLFERFLSEHRTDGRTEAPDIDVDFEMDRREEVLDYVYNRYARAHAAITAVTQAFHAPAAVQDMMRALGYPAELAFAISKRLHALEPSDGASLIEESLAEANGLSVSDPRVRALLAAMRSLDDVPRLRSTHPGGFVLSRGPLGAYMPIEHTTMGRTIIQFDKDDLDAAGVPKFDFLGLGSLTAVHLAFDAIEQRTGERLELYNLPTDDAPTFEMISRGDTVGTFQIESRAQIQSILQTEPERLYDIVVQVALIRPGPIQAKFVRPYTRRRRGLEEVRYAHPLLEPILRRTQGIPIFQEQAMAISVALGGFTAAEADELRRSMGHHRKVARLQGNLQHLRERMVARGIAEDVAREVCDDMMIFANYGFPESHAWSFALIAYATAYLKAHFPAEFFLGLLNAWPMGFYPPATLVHDARRHGVVVLPPCLMRGEWECTVEASGSASLGSGAAPPGSASLDTGASRPGSAPAALGSTSLDTGASRPGSAPAALGSTSLGSGAARLGSKRRESVAALSSAVAVAMNGDDGSDADAASPAEPFEPSERSERSPSPAEPKAERSPPTRGPVSRTPQTSPALRIGWKHIRGLGDAVGEALRVARAEAPFVSVEDVVRRANLSRADALHLARAGAFEAFEPGRRKAAWEALRVAGDLLPLAPARVLPFTPRELEGEELVFLDYLATGVCTHGHPVEHLRARLEAAGVVASRELADQEDGASIVVAGLVVARQHPSTAKGTVFVLLEDEHGFVNVIVPAKTYEANREVVKFSPFLVVEGVFERDGNVLNVVGRRFRRLDAGQLMFRSRDFR